MMENNFEKLYNEILNCRDCCEEFGFTPSPIIFGSNNSKIIQISQAPSKSVNESLKPFQDASGRKLIHEWYQIEEKFFYDTRNFYITSISHCFPGKTKSGGDKTPPKKCADKWLKKEISIVNNQIFIIIGRCSANYFFPKIDYNQLIFQDNFIYGKLAYVLPHPSPLNVRWFKEHPEFDKRMETIRGKIHSILEIENIRG